MADGLFHGYEPMGFCEVFDTQGARLHYARLEARLDRLDATEMAARADLVGSILRRQGITFNVYGNQEGIERTWPLDLVPRIRKLRPDLRIEPLRGNLDTRLRKLDEGGYDAIVLAAAGLTRLGLAQRIRSLFEPTQMIPAAGQGALGLEIREDDEVLRRSLAQLSHAPTWLATHAERAVSRSLGGSCSVPLAAHVTWTAPGQMHLAVALGDAEHGMLPLLKAEVQAEVDDTDAAEALGRLAAAHLRERGAARYLAHLNG